MTESCYISIKPYLHIIQLFAKSGEYIGGADGLFPIYEREFNLGQKVNQSCSSCVSAMLLHLAQMIKDYEQANGI